MAFPGFHPLVRRWFTAAVGTPTPAQQRAWEAIAAGRHTLVAAPTGSGKTLAAFLTAINGLLEESQGAPLPDEVRVVYVSPLKALSTDIHRNLAEPRAAIGSLAEAAGLRAPGITTAVRTGDTSQSERAAMLRTPPHILVTTPESLYLLLTAERSRQMLRTVRTVIVDEIHAVIGTRRGAHLALTLERLQKVSGHPLQRIGLSATQTPIDEVASFLTAGDPAGCAIVDVGHRRAMDLGVEIPRSDLDAVMSSEVWEEYYDRLTELIRTHRTTLVFVNTRKMAERTARHLSDRLGDDAVTAHHGSLSKEKRLDAETRLKTGRLRALVATASLELGIDIGHVDLVCQIGSPHRIATLLQRVGRSGHTLAGTPKGRVFPESRDDLVECAALLRSIRRGQLDAIVTHDAPLDVLAQQIVAECACCEYAEDDLFALVKRAWPYRSIDRAAFDAVVRMTAEGFATRRGRRSALVHRDEVNGTLRGRRGARLLAQTSGGAIPEIADYRVVLDPDGTVVGTLNEDFAIESNAGDIFQLGNTSWLILQVAGGDVRVADARGAPPTIPFWLGEAPARSDELSRAVSDLRAEADSRLRDAPPASVADWLMAEAGLGKDAAAQVVAYLAAGRRALGVIPSQQTLVLERFFDESGGMQLVLHAPFGSRINKAWGLALRKRFCRQFNFELQAAATEDALMLSLGPQHSFPLSDVFRYLHPETTKDVLVQAFLDAPVFKTRWRWNTTISLAVPRARGSRRVPPPIQRMLADDLMAAVFPDAAACLENIPGDRQIPDHPLVSQTVKDCLEEAMDLPGLLDVLTRIHQGRLRLVARDTPEPSVFADEILNARPYAFLDDAPLEERRSHAVQSRRSTDAASDVGALDADAVARVREEERPEPRDADELHDALLTAGFLTHEELAGVDPALLAALAATRRAGQVERSTAGLQARATADLKACATQAEVAAQAEVAQPFRAAPAVVIAAERLPELRAIHPDAVVVGDVQPPASRQGRTWTRGEAITELLRGRLTLTGPVTAAELAGSLDIETTEADAALLQLETEGVVLRGRFSPGGTELQWCDRTLLARIHRYTLHRLRAEIEPVTPADFMRFLFRWQHVDQSCRLTGPDGLREVVATLDGYELAAGAWERDVLSARLDRYEPSMLDMLCLSGEAAWARLSPVVREGTGIPALVPATPVALFLREHAATWRALRTPGEEPALSDHALMVLSLLRTRGASFFADLASASGLDADQLRTAIGTLVACGLATSDGYSGLRALVWAARGGAARHDRRSSFAGRWTAIDSNGEEVTREEAVEIQAWTLLRRYGVVFRRLLTRETNAAPWRELARVYRRLEARGEIRGGRFVSGMSGEQFALPDAVRQLREVRRMHAAGQLVTISAADPLNLTGIVTAGERIRTAGRNRIVYRDGVPLTVREGDFTRELAPNGGAEHVGNQKRSFMTARVATLLTALLLIAALGAVPAAQDAPAQKADAAKSAKAPKKDLPLEPARTISFETSEGSWLSLDVAPDGQKIVFELLGDLYTLPMAGGAATRITSGMAFDSQPRFSPDGSRIVFISDRSGDDNLWTIKADGSDAKALTKGTNQTYMSPEWTLDPNYIVATRSSGQAGMQLWLYHVDGGSGMQLTGKAEDQRQLNPVGAAFGKDPRYIWFTVRTATGSVYNQMSFRWQLSVYDRKTGEVFRQSDELGSAMRPVLSPDGKWLVYATRHDAQTGFRVRNLETGDDQWLAYPVQRDDQESRATRDLMPGSAFTPDSSALITSFDGRIWRVDVPSGAVKPIPFTAKVEQQVGAKLDFDYTVDQGEVQAQQIRHPVLSPDGTRLAFTAFDRLYVMDYPKGTPRRLTDASVGEHQPNWSPDGRHIIYVTWSDADAGHVRRVPAAGGAVETLTQVPSFYSEPVYTPDGSRIVVVRGPRVERMEDFSSSGTGGQGLDLVWMPAAGGALTRIAPHRGSSPHFGPENDRIYVWEGRGGLVSFRFDGTDRREHVKVTGYRAPDAQQAGPASAGRISPDGRFALVEAQRNLYVVTIPVIGGEAPTISVANPSSASVPVRRLTRVGGEFGRWAAKGDRATWAIGRAFFDYDIPAARAAEEKDRLAKAAAGEKPEASDKPSPAAGEDQTAEQKKPTPPVYDAKETEIAVTMPRPKPGGSVVLRGARIITMKGDEVIENGDVVVTGNRIAAVGRRGSVKVPAGAQVIDVAGKTIMPGLVDVHAHIRTAFGVHRTQVWEYLANLAYGVTTTRDPQTATSDVVTYRDLVEAGMMLGPRIYHTGPGVFSQDNVQSLEEARDVLRRYSKYWDTKTIKQYMAGNRQQRQWIVMAAREQQLMPTLEGGLDLKLNLTQIIDGYSGLEHSLPIVPLYKDVVQLVAQSGIVYTPTLLVLYGGPWAENYFYEEGDIHADEKLRRFTPHAELDEAVLRRPWFHPQEYAHPMHAKVLTDIVKAGGKVGLGGHGQRQGIGVHWELWAIASGGMAPHDALKIATIVGADAIGLDKDLGSIEAGKLADLIVLDRNPLEDVRHTNTIRHVMKDGWLFDGATLDSVWPEKKPLPRQYWWDADPRRRTDAPQRPWIRRE